MILSLFKYYSPTYEGKNNLAFYEKGQIYFQQPEKFNDPWDCKAPKIFSPRSKKFLKEFHYYLSRGYSVDLVDAEWEKNEKLRRGEIREKYRLLFEEALENIRQKIGVFSLSFIPDSELMWSHYASSHSGYMLHFKIDINEYLTNPVFKEIGIPIPVAYKKKRPTLNIATYYSNREKHIYDLIRFKSEAWSYENELRLMNEAKYGFIDLPETWLQSITVGLAARSAFKEALKNIGRKLHIPVFLAHIHEENYKIEIPGLHIDGIEGRSSYKKLLDSRILELK
ncbi:MAG: DUF2971 domain-containing protein [Candidatus Electrothrix sp. Rat3]|nr:DUF2971 domain-containing protein [Candidatus Electrothrix rattekaaiensis]